MRKSLPLLLGPRGRAIAVASLVVPVVAVLAAGTGVAGGAQTSAALYPDLQTVVPRHLGIQNQQQHDYLRFSNGIANTGDGPWALRPEHVGGVTNAIQEIRDADGNVVSEHLASQFEFHPAHNHWHIGDIAQFDVRKGSPTGPVVSNASIKVTFCLIDWYRLEGNSPTTQKEFWDCETSYQGVSVGWVDQYHQSLEGQKLDLTDAPNANDYYLVSTTNYANKFLEKTTANNTAWVKFRLYSDSKGNRKIEVLGNSPCSSPGLCGENAPNR
jgi:hypothetical protein